MIVDWIGFDEVDSVDPRVIVIGNIIEDTVVIDREYEHYIESTIFGLPEFSNNRLTRRLLKSNGWFEWIRDNCKDTVYYYERKLYFENKNDLVLFRLAFSEND